MREIPENLGSKIVELARLAAWEHVRQDQDRARQTRRRPGVGGNLAVGVTDDSLTVKDDPPPCLAGAGHAAEGAD
jgi:hypothetical protein